MISTQVSIPGYKVGQKLYDGSRTLVYRAFQETNQKPVVIKLLKNPYSSFSEIVQFRNQYTIAKNLNFPGIIQTYSLEAYQNGYVLVMEDFGGISLTEWRSKEGKKSQSLIQFLQIAISICHTLAFLYRHNIIHKDIKLANILIHPETKQVKLIDFSIASLLPWETQTIISPNLLEGTLAYISPEQTGRMNRGVDYRSDFYSLGVTLYELLTGELPFKSDDPMELVHCHIAKKPPLLTDREDIPQVVSDIVMKLMAKNAEDRYQNALGLKYDLEKCLLQLEETGKISYFEIAKRDICDKFIIPEKLYGREMEVEELLKAFHRVSTGNSEMMLVAGLSGIGKTAVVSEVHKPIVKQRGYFIKGKFDQFNRNIPFSAFVQAFRNLMRQLLTESDKRIQQWHNKILQALGDNAQVIIEIIPELEIIIGKQPPTAELSGSTAQNRFNLLLQKFIQVFTTQEHPLVIFLDDLQWADSASLKLIQLLMSEATNGHLLLIGAYRDNEVSPAHPLRLTLDQIDKIGAIINKITLNPLNEFKLNQLVADTLVCEEKLALPLSQLIYQKTQGNPFFATQFLKALHQEKLIFFNYDQGCWQCDIADINQKALTNEIVEFMTLQLQKLPESTQNVLKLAACIGNEFDLETLAIVCEQSQVKTADFLWKALQGGLILPQSDIYKFYIGLEHGSGNQENAEIVTYKFLHDRIQQAAYSLIPEVEKQNVHYQIGQLLLQKFSPEAREERIFEVVNQLNYGIALIVEQTQLEELAQLNLIACCKARTATAYQTAREYATVGLSLLEENAWQRQYKLTLELHELAAEVASLCGDFAQMEQLISIVNKQAHSLLEQVNVYRIKIQSHISQNQFAEAIAIAQQILQQLGVTFPETPTPTDIQRSIQEIGELIANREIQDLVHLPMMTDGSKIAIVQIASSIMPVAYLSGSPLFPLLICLSVKLSVLYGNTSASAYIYSSYGVMLCNFLQDVDTATQFGQLVLQILSKLDTKTTKPQVLLILGIYILQRKAHIEEMLPLLQEGYTTALEVGNLEFAGHNAHNFCSYSFWCGQPLETLEQNTRVYSHELAQLNQLTTANYCRIYRQSILNLLGFTEHPSILSGEAFQAQEFLPLLLSANDGYGLYAFYMYSLVLCYLFEELESAKNHAIEVRRYFMAGAGLVSEPAFYLYDSLIVLAKLSQNSDAISEELHHVAENQTQLQHWAYYAPMNYQHKVDLVQAEKYRVLGKNYEAGDWYDRAISGAKENKYIQEEAIANELAAKFYLDWGKETIAAGYMQQAYYCYTRWGTKAKIRDLEKRYPQLLKPILQQRRFHLNPWETIPTRAFSQTSLSDHSSSDLTTSISDTLDFTSILKAAQAISSSIEIDELVTNLTQIILENSGAKKSVLILPQEDTWQIRAITLVNQANLQSEIQTSLAPQLLDTSQDVPIKIINYVKNTQETVVIDNCKTDITMLIGEYMLEHQPKSTLCTPIINQGHLVGILYLENKITSGVFTQARLQLINLLSSQAAISLENARLYQQAQQALENLQQAQLKIVQSEKMSALGNLVAGVAHEMNNPLGFIYATLEQTKPALDDIIEHIKLYQANLSNQSEEIIEHAEEIDLNYSLEDLPKMINGMIIACERLKNISTSLRTFSRADQNYKVPFNIHEGIDSTILILKHRLKANEQHPEIEVINEYGDLPQIDCFPGQLNQVFMNILANAIDALDELNMGRSFAEIKANPNKITVKTLTENNWVKISIADNAKGLREEVKQKIFDYLFTTKVVGKGTGLGLAIARQIIEETHAGKLSCNSILGEGTEFIIEIPVSV
ncbi:trifunctional serine/threonine-protein kinase/ATP-binding protein/sensor histidine kinase [Anabaena sp. WFMT]|uniref:trifunctional serine/threonine-protein kinase/ATP-binding protein/sensor histidine kinase n=1 Tax=Anabaena sp. WFMT TaxID=3449730 RepID=UPI003F22A96B